MRNQQTGQGITEFALVLIVVVFVVLTVAGSHSGNAFSNVSNATASP